MSRPAPSPLPIALALLAAGFALLPAAPVEAQRAGAYPNCAAARAAGAAPIRRGQPGYGPHLDRDGDGVACEPYRAGGSSRLFSGRKRRRR